MGKLPRACADIGGIRITLSQKLGSIAGRAALDRALESVKVAASLLPQEAAVEAQARLDDLATVDAVLGAYQRTLRAAEDALGILEGREAEATSRAASAALMMKMHTDCIRAAQPSLDINTETRLPELIDVLRGQVALLNTKRSSISALTASVCLVAVARGHPRFADLHKLPDDFGHAHLRGDALVTAALRHVEADQARRSRDKARQKAQLQTDLQGEVAALWEQAA